MLYSSELMLESELTTDSSSSIFWLSLDISSFGSWGCCVVEFGINDILLVFSLRIINGTFTLLPLCSFLWAWFSFPIKFCSLALKNTLPLKSLRNSKNSSSFLRTNEVTISPPPSTSNFTVSLCPAALVPRKSSSILNVIGLAFLWVSSSSALMAFIL